MEPIPVDEKAGGGGAPCVSSEDSAATDLRPHIISTDVRHIKLPGTTVGKSVLF